MRSEASHLGPHYACVPALPIVTAERRNDCFASQLSRERSAIEASCYLVISRSPPSNSRGQRHLLKGARGRRPQRPGNQPRSHASWMFSPRQLSRELPAATGSAAINRRTQERSRFAVATFLHVAPAGNPKKALVCAEAVDGGSSLWKDEEN
jgi:hypothetical protein